MRCLTLAGELRRRGADIVFLCRAGTLETVSALGRAGFPVVAVAGTTAATLAATGSCDAVVFDGYAIGEDEERACRAFAPTIVVIDDLADRRHDCDLLVDQNFGRDANDYAALVPAGCKILAGARYALLRPEFAAARPAALARRATGPAVGRILVSMGLTDIGGITGRLVPMLAALLPDVAFDVVLGPTATSLATLRVLAEASPRVALHVDTSDMCSLSISADLAVGAGGSSAWERCCLGLPTATIVLADNQRDATRRLVEAGATVVADLDAAAKLVEMLVRDSGRRDALSRAATSICDGDGAIRVAGALMARMAGAGSGAVRIRSATTGDADLLLRWRNDPHTVAMSGTPSAIDREAHVAWFARALADPNRPIFIGEADEDEPIGMCRFDVDQSHRSAVVSIALDPAARGRHLSPRLLRAGIAALRAKRPEIATLDAVIRHENAASLRLFAAAGFEPHDRGAETGRHRLTLGGECR